MSTQMGVIVHKITLRMRVAGRVARSVAPVNQTGAGASVSIGQTAPSDICVHHDGSAGPSVLEGEPSDGFAGGFPWPSGGDDTHCEAVVQPPLDDASARRKERRNFHPPVPARV